jgi:hypothetical protein
VKSILKNKVNSVREYRYRTQLDEKIEKVRKLMIENGLISGFNDPLTIILSERLDDLINEFLRNSYTINEKQ